MKDRPIVTWSKTSEQLLLESLKSSKWLVVEAEVKNMRFFFSCLFTQSHSPKTKSIPFRWVSQRKRSRSTLRPLERFPNSCDVFRWNDRNSHHQNHCFFHEMLVGFWWFCLACTGWWFVPFVEFGPGETFEVESQKSFRSSLEPSCSKRRRSQARYQAKALNVERLGGLNFEWLEELIEVMSPDSPIFTWFVLYL